MIIWQKNVASHVGAWIEITVSAAIHYMYVVASHVGAWIEITAIIAAFNNRYVASHVGAWIEIFKHFCIEFIA